MFYAVLKHCPNTTLCEGLYCFVALHFPFCFVVPRAITLHCLNCHYFLKHCCFGTVVIATTLLIHCYCAGLCAATPHQTIIATLRHIFSAHLSEMNKCDQCYHITSMYKFSTNLQNTSIKRVCFCFQF